MSGERRALLLLAELRRSVVDAEADAQMALRHVPTSWTPTAAVVRDALHDLRQVSERLGRELDRVRREVKA